MVYFLTRRNTQMAKSIKLLFLFFLVHTCNFVHLVEIFRRAITSKGYNNVIDMGFLFCYSEYFIRSNTQALVSGFQRHGSVRCSDLKLP